MNLTFEEFELLQLLVRKKSLTLHQIRNELTGLLPIEIDNALKRLVRKRLVVDDQNIVKPHDRATATLQPYKVRRAVILGAGKGERMRPATELLPKPMVCVNGRRIIETQLDALSLAGITDITIVRGYHGEVFDDLLDYYPDLKFIDNPHWETEGAIVSAALAIDLLEDAYLLEGDIFIHEPEVIRPYEYRSAFCGITGRVSDDWYTRTDDSWRIAQLAYGDTPINHDRTHRWLGIMFWDKAHAKQLKADLAVFLQEPANRQGFIESIPFGAYSKNYNIYLRPLSADTAIELDTYIELEKLRVEQAERCRRLPATSVRQGNMSTVG